jgi:glycosyltransferase involved in cell wall biosynthesis
VFSKSEAINDAASRAKGEIFVIMDSDAYLSASVILRCAAAIEAGKAIGHNVWFMPYRHLYRLTERATDKVLTSNPCRPYQFPIPPDAEDVESTVGSEHGHYFGAMVQIMPREAFETVGCWDPRFRGWGGEDISFLLAVDTLWGKHKSVDATVFHLWHPTYTTGQTHTRLWEGQKQNTYSKLAARYRAASGDYDRMRVLVDEGCECQESCECGGPVNWPLILFYWILAFLTLAWIFC